MRVGGYDQRNEDKALFLDMSSGKGTPGAYSSTDVLCTLMGTRLPSAPVTVVTIRRASVRTTQRRGIRKLESGKTIRRLDDF